MYTLSHKHRSPSFTTGENRLLHETPEKMTLEQEVMSVVSANPTELQLDELAKKLQGEKGKEVLAKVEGSLSSLEKRTQTKAQLNMLLLGARLNVEKQTDVQKQALMNQIATEKKEETPQTIGGMITNFSVGVTDTLLPTSWTKEWSTRKKALVGAGITVGATVIIGSLISAWFRSKNAVASGLAAGTQAEGGFLKKLLIGLGIGAAALVGLDMLNKKLKNPLGLPDNLLPRLPVEAASAVTDVAAGAGNQFLDTGDKAMSVGGKNVEFLTKVASQESVGEALQYALSNGGALAYENGAFLLHIGTQAIALPATVTGKILNWMRTGKRDEDLFMLYGASGAAYFVGQKTFNLLMRGQARTLIPLTKKDLIFTALKIASGPLAPLNDALSIASRTVTPQGREALHLRYIKQSVPGQVVWGIANSGELAFKGGLATNDGMLAAVQQWKVLQRDMEIMQMFDKKTLRMFSDAEVTSVVRAQETMADSIRLALKKLPIDDSTPAVIRELKDVCHMGIEGFTEKMDEIWKGFTKTANAPHTASTSSHSAGAQPKPVPANAVDTAAESAKIKKIDELLNTPEMTKAFEEAGEAGRQAKIRMHIQLEAVGDDALDVLKSKSGQKLLRGAIGSTDELGHLITAAQKAQNCLKNMKWCAVGVVADAVGPLLAYFAILDNNEKIRNTNNPALKRVYENSNFIYTIDGGIQSAIGISMGGLGVYSLVAGGPLMIGALPVAAYLGPIGVGVAIGSAIASHEVEELKRLELRYAQSEKDLVQSTPGHILKYIDESKGLEDTKLLTAILDIGFRQTDFQSAETFTRVQGYRAYFAQIADTTVQKPTILDVDDDTAIALEKMGKVHVEQHLKNMQKQRINDFVNDAEQYIAYKTNNQFHTIDAQILKRATTYAQLQCKERYEGKSLSFVAWNNERYWGKQDQLIATQESTAYKATRNSLVEASANPNEFAENMPLFVLQMIHDDLAICEKSVLDATYSGSWFGVENERAAARGNYAQSLKTILTNTIQHVKQIKSITYKEMDQVVLSMKDVLSKSPNDMAKDVEQNHAAEKTLYTDIGSTVGRLTEGGIMELLRTAA